MKKKLSRQKIIYPFEMLKRKIWIILLFGVVTFGALYPIASKKVKKYYVSEGMIEIYSAKTSTSSGQTRGVIGYRDYVRSHMFRIKSNNFIDKCADKVLEKIEDENIDKKTMKMIIARSLSVSQELDTNFISLTTKSVNNKYLKLIVDSMIDTFIMSIMDENKNKDSFRIKDLEEQEKKEQEKLKEFEDKIRDIAIEIGTWEFSNANLPYKMQMNSLELASMNAYKDKIKAENNYNGLLEKIRQIKDLSLEGAIEEKLANDSVLNSRKLAILRQIEELNTKIVELSPENIERRNIEKKINILFQAIEKVNEEAREKAEKSLKILRTYNDELEVIELQKTIKALSDEEKQLNESLKDIKEKYALVTEKAAEAYEYQKKIINIKVSISNFEKRISQLKLDVNSSDFASVVSYGSPADYISETNLKKIMILLFLFSFGWIFLVSFILEILDKRIKSVKDITDAFGFEPSWPISHLKNKDFINLSLSKDINTSYKAINSLALKLNRGRVESNDKIALFTGVNATSGVTEIIINCAHFMKKNCTNVLYVELNRERPKIINKITLTKEKDSKISNKSDLADKVNLGINIYKDLERDIDLIPFEEFIGRDNKEILNFLSKLKEVYDYIFIDTAPILTSDLTELIALNSDIGLLVVNGNKTMYDRMVHAVEIFKKMEIKSFGVVLNWGKTKKDIKAKKVKEVG